MIIIILLLVSLVDLTKINIYEVPEKKYSLRYGFISKIQLQFNQSIYIKNEDNLEKHIQISHYQQKITNSTKTKVLQPANFCLPLDPSLQLLVSQNISILNICKKDCLFKLIDQKLYLLVPEGYLKIFKFTPEFEKEISSYLYNIRQHHKTIYYSDYKDFKFNLSFYAEILINDSSINISEFRFIQNQKDQTKLLIIGNDHLHFINLYYNVATFDKQVYKIPGIINPKFVHYWGDLIIIVFEESINIYQFQINSDNFLNFQLELLKRLEYDDIYQEIVTIGNKFFDDYQPQQLRIESILQYNQNYILHDQSNNLIIFMNNNFMPQVIFFCDNPIQQFTFDGFYLTILEKIAGRTPSNFLLEYKVDDLQKLQYLMDNQEISREHIIRSYNQAFQLNQNITLESEVMQLITTKDYLIALQKNMVSLTFAQIPNDKLPQRIQTYISKDITENVQQILDFQLLEFSQNVYEDEILILDDDYEKFKLRETNYQTKQFLIAQKIDAVLFIYVLCYVIQFVIYEIVRDNALVQCYPKYIHTGEYYYGIQIGSFNSSDGSFNVYYQQLVFNVYHEYFENANIALFVGLTIGLAFTFFTGVIFCVYFYKMRTKYHQQILEQEEESKKQDTPPDSEI